LQIVYASGAGDLELEAPGSLVTQLGAATSVVEVVRVAESPEVGAAFIIVPSIR
jgi:hypothetical protein